MQTYENRIGQIASGLRCALLAPGVSEKSNFVTQIYGWRAKNNC